MNDHEFIIDAINRLIPESEWHGESNLDSQSLKNIDIQYEALESIMDKLFKNIVIYGWKSNASAEAIQEKKRKALEYLIEYLDDLPGLIGYKIVKIQDNSESREER